MEPRSASSSSGRTRRAESASGGHWSPIARDEVAAWNARLLDVPGASLFQLPYWNEPLRALGFRPHFLAYRADAAPAAYACVLGLGPRGLRAGLVQRGPVPLTADPAVRQRAWRDLAAWGRRQGYVFLRFTHADAAFLDELADSGTTERIDPFPFYREPQQELLVPQRMGDDALLASFQRVARSDIRKAIETGYRIESASSPDALAALWPLFERVARRKRFTFRPLDSFLALLRAAEPFGAARVYVARLDDVPVQAIVVARDRDVAYNVIGALDVPALGGRRSPAELLHWQAMRDFARLGVEHYCLGSRSGTVYEFKRKFRPTEHDHPPPVTLVTSPLLYRSWRSIGLTAVRTVWPRLKRSLAGGSRRAAAAAHRA